MPESDNGIVVELVVGEEVGAMVAFYEIKSTRME